MIILLKILRFGCLDISMTQLGRTRARDEPNLFEFVNLTSEYGIKPSVPGELEFVVKTLFTLYARK